MSNTLKTISVALPGNLDPVVKKYATRRGKEFPPVLGSWGVTHTGGVGILMDSGHWPGACWPKPEWISASTP